MRATARDPSLGDWCLERHDLGLLLGGLGRLRRAAAARRGDGRLERTRTKELGGALLALLLTCLGLGLGFRVGVRVRVRVRVRVGVTVTVTVTVGG